MLCFVAHKVKGLGCLACGQKGIKNGQDLDCFSPHLDVVYVFITLGPVMCVVITVGSFELKQFLSKGTCYVKCGFDAKREPVFSEY